MVERLVGVEEELLLVNPETFRLEGVSHRALSAYVENHRRLAGAAREPSNGKDLEQELFLQQLETAPAPCAGLDALKAEIWRCRRAASDAAGAVGARVVAVGTPVLGGSDVTVTQKPRYERIVHEFGEIGRQGAVCGMHVHVNVDNDDEAVAVLDRIRPWLPVLLAISANSPFWHGRDTGYASWRSQVWKRWPSAGPSEPFGDPAGYRAAVADLIASGAAIDTGMLYFDARLAESYPTVEIRVADVCTEVDDAVLIAALCRGLVETVAGEWRGGVPSPVWRTDLLRAAHWRGGRDGMSHHLVDPTDRRAKPAREVLESLIDRVSPALVAAGDLRVVKDATERLLAGGAGAGRQRAVRAAHGSLEAVVADLGERTDGVAFAAPASRSVDHERVDANLG